MSDIELVIKIPQETYEATCSGSLLPPDVENVVNAIKDGTPLSKYTSLKKSYKKTYVSDGEAIKGANDTLRNLGMDYWE